MDRTAHTAPPDQPKPAPSADQRSAPRFTLLIRAAKLVSAQGEFVCVIRDVSETGVSVRLFHTLPACDHFALHLPGGSEYEISRVWQRDNQAGFTFMQAVDVSRLINESSDYPKRGLRLGLCFPVIITTRTQRFEGVAENMSQQGARIACDALLAIDQAVRISAPGIHGEVRAKVRWRRDTHYGMVFDDTFTLSDFAHLAARFQAPALLND